MPPMSQPKILLHKPSLSKDIIYRYLRDPSTKSDFENQSNRHCDQQIIVSRLLEKSLVLKHYQNARKGIERIRPLRLTRAWRSYQAANRLESAGISTPTPQFLVEWNQGLVLACDRIEGQQLFELLRDKKWIESNATRLIKELSDLLGKLEEAKITHGDLHPRNILVDRSGKAWLVDLDGMRFHKSRATFARIRQREENRFATRLEIQPEILTQLGFRRGNSHWTMQT